MSTEVHCDVKCCMILFWVICVVYNAISVMKFIDYMTSCVCILAEHNPFIPLPSTLSMTQSTPVANESGAMTQPWRMLSNWLWISRCGDNWQQVELCTDGACRIMMMKNDLLWPLILYKKYFRKLVIITFRCQAVNSEISEAPCCPW